MRSQAKGRAGRRRDRDVPFASRGGPLPAKGEPWWDAPATHPRLTGRAGPGRRVQAPAHVRGAADGTGGERWGEVGTGTSWSTSAPRPRWAIAGKKGDHWWVGLTTYMRPTGRAGISGTGVYATIN